MPNEAPFAASQSTDSDISCAISVNVASLFVRPRPVWTGSHYPPRKCINHERVFLLETNAVIAQQQCE